MIWCRTLLTKRRTHISLCRKPFPRPGLGAVAAWTVLILTAAPASAQSGWHTSLTLATDYVQRGRSQTGGDPALQAEATYRFAGGAQVSAWTSTTEQPLGPEVDLLAGLSRAFADDWAWNLGVGYYSYPDNELPGNFDRVEVNAALAWSDRVTLLLAWSPETPTITVSGVERGPAATAEITGQWQLQRWLSLAAGLGHRDQPAVGSYGYWNVALGARYGRALLDLSRIGADARARAHFSDAQAGDRTVLTLTVRFTGP